MDDDTLSVNGNITSIISAELLFTRISQLEKEKRNLEFKLHTYETKYNELNIVATGYMDTIRELREEKQKLERELAELKVSNDELKASNVDLKVRVKVLEEKEANKEMQLKLGQCIYDYKIKLKARIGAKLNSRWDLFDIINGHYDKHLSPSALSNRDILISEIEAKYSTMREFQIMLSDMTVDRVRAAHPDISGEYSALRDITVLIARGLSKQ